MAAGSRKMRLRIDTDVQQTSRSLLYSSQPCESIGAHPMPVTPGTPGALFSTTSSASWPSPVTPSSRAPWSPRIRSPVSESPTPRRPSDFDARQYTNTVSPGEPKNHPILSPIRRLSSSLRGFGGYRSLKEVTNPHLMRLASTVVNNGLDDWSLVEDVLRGATASSTNAKSVLRCIIRGLMTGEVVQQLSAGRLWAILMKNANSFVLDQATRADFLLDVERVINSSCIEMVVVDRVISVLATSIHDYSSHSRAEQFGPLWRRICARRVTDSTPLHPDDPLYHPGSLVRPSIDPTIRGDTTTIASPYYPPATGETSDERSISPGGDSDPLGNSRPIPDAVASGPVKKVGVGSKRQVMTTPKVVVEEVVDLPPPYSPSAMSQSDAGPSTLRVPAVVDTYPFAKGYANDIGLNINIDSLESHPFAKGAFGDVRRAYLRDGRQVAIKCLRFYTSAQDTGRHRLERKSLKEIRVWSFLEHDNVLPLLGLCIINNELGMVSEFMPNGNIQDYIRENPAADRYYLAINVCAGLVYLHEHPKRVVHGDLKAVNVVVDANGTPKLTDFGLAQMIRAEDSTERSSSSSVGGTSRWMARELICPPAPHADCCKPNLSSDVYALGMTLYEIFAGVLPFASRRNDAQVIGAIMRGELPERISDIFTDELWELLLQCWQPDPQYRPSARDILVALQSLARPKSR